MPELLQVPDCLPSLFFLANDLKIGNFFPPSSALLCSRVTWLHLFSIPLPVPPSFLFLLFGRCTTHKQKHGGNTPSSSPFPLPPHLAPSAFRPPRLRARKKDTQTNKQDPKIDCFPPPLLLAVRRLARFISLSLLPLRREGCVYVICIYTNQELGPSSLAADPSPLCHFASFPLPLCLFPLSPLDAPPKAQHTNPREQNAAPSSSVPSPLYKGNIKSKGFTYVVDQPLFSPCLLSPPTTRSSALPPLPPR